jgi:hypothetical protein
MNYLPRLQTAKIILLACLLGGWSVNFGSAQTAAPATPLVTSIVPDGKMHKFEARDHQFWIDGQPTMLLAGEMHFGRVQPED